MCVCVVIEETKANWAQWIGLVCAENCMLNSL